MGNWQLEVFRMSLYISFPVGLFYFFNQPQFFEGWMMEKRVVAKHVGKDVEISETDSEIDAADQKNQLFPPQDPRAKEMIEAHIEKSELRKEQEMLAAFKSKQ